MLYNDWKEGAAAFRANSDTWQVLLYNHRHYANLDASWETPEGIEAMVGTGSSREFSLRLTGLPPSVRVKRSLLDRVHGWAEGAWRKMGAPDWPKGGQLAELRKLQEPCCSCRLLYTDGGSLSLNEKVSDLGVVFMEIERAEPFIILGQSTGFGAPHFQGNLWLRRESDRAALRPRANPQANHDNPFLCY